MADKYLEVIGYTEHGLRHTDIVSKAAYNILKKRSFSEGEARAGRGSRGFYTTSAICSEGAITIKWD